MKLSLVDKSKAEEVAKLAVCLTNEIIARTGVKHFNVDTPLAIKLCQDFMVQGHYHVIAARDGDTIVGFGALRESRSLYAEGTLGIIQEFYVLPDYRSQGVAKHCLRKLQDLRSKKHGSVWNFVPRQYRNLRRPLPSTRPTVLKLLAATR